MIYSRLRPIILGTTQLGACHTYGILFESLRDDVRNVSWVDKGMYKKKKWKSLGLT